MPAPDRRNGPQCERLLLQFSLMSAPPTSFIVVRHGETTWNMQARMQGHQDSSLTAAGFSRLVEQVSIGVSMEDALHELGRNTGLTEYRFFATTLTLQNQTGGTLSDTLESLADVIRKRVALKAKGKAMTSEARSSSAVLAVLPLATALLLWVVSPEYIMVLFTTAQGKSMLGLAAIMLACGLLSIHTLIQKTLT